MVTLGSMAEFDKECLLHAMRGEVYAGDGDDGPEFEGASLEDCERAALEILDKWYFNAKQLADSGRAVERIIKRHGWKFPFSEYIEEMAKAEAEFQTYLYEHEKDALAEEISELEGGAR